MGFDIIGIKATSKSGEYFRNNVWWWRPLWSYVCEVCDHILSENDMEAGEWNDCYRISGEKADQIAKKLFSLIKQKKVQEYSKEYKSNLVAIPDEECTFCGGSGQRHDEFVQGQCNGCSGKGKTRPFITWYPFDVKNVKKFAEFCRDSGGFDIC